MAEKLYLSNEALFSITNNEKVFIVDVSAPSSPLPLNEQPVPGCPKGIFFIADLVLISAGFNLLIYDATNLSSLSLLASLPMKVSYDVYGLFAENIVANNNAIFLVNRDKYGAYWTRNILIIDYSVPSVPVQSDDIYISELFAGGNPSDILLDGAILYVASDNPNTLLVFNVATPFGGGFFQVGTNVLLAGTEGRLSKDGDILYVVTMDAIAGSFTVSSYNVLIPSAPVFIGSLSLSSYGAQTVRISSYCGHCFVAVYSPLACYLVVIVGGALPPVFKWDKIVTGTVALELSVKDGNAYVYSVNSDGVGVGSRIEVFDIGG